MVSETFIDEVRERIFPIVLLLYAPAHLLGAFLFPIGPPKVFSPHILLALIYISCLGHFYFSCTLLLI